jgi:hypothetical protein
MASSSNIKAGAAYIELYTKDSRLVKGLNDAAKRLDAFGKSLQGIGTKMAMLGAGIVTQHISQSIVNVGSYAAQGFSAPNFFGAIGVTDDRVEGTDITVPVFNFTETHYILNELVTPAYKLALFNLTGKVNGATFKGFAKGEVLFLGASGSKRGLDDWEITFRFAASPNVSGLSLGSITGISKEGWNYLWVRFTDDEDATAKALIKRPVAAYVEQVYPYGSFSGLGIGV